MSEEKLTAAEVAMLFALMAEAQEVSNVELKERYGIALTGKYKEHLNTAGLVSTRKVGRALAHTLEDQGWARCRRELNAPPPVGAGTAGGGLYALLHGLDRYLESENLSLADVFRRKVADVEPSPDHQSGEVIEADIRQAYDKLAPAPGARVSLTELRPLLGGASRADVDATLNLMGRMPSTFLETQEDQKRLTPADRTAAVRIGQRQYHFLVIESA